MVLLPLMAVKMAEAVEVEAATAADELLNASAETILGKNEVDEVGLLIAEEAKFDICCAILTLAEGVLGFCLDFGSSTVCKSNLATLLLTELLEDLESRFRFRGDFDLAYKYKN